MMPMKEFVVAQRTPTLECVVFSLTYRFYLEKNMKWVLYAKEMMYPKQCTIS